MITHKQTKAEEKKWYERIAQFEALQAIMTTRY